MSYFHGASMIALLVSAFYPVLALIFDANLPRHRAVLATMLFGFLFLPSLEFDVGGMIYWNRNTAPVFMVLAGVLFRDGALLAKFRMRWFDIPMLVYCVVPLFTSLDNGYGLKEGLALSFYQTVRWAGPYFIARLHFQTKEQLLDLVYALFLGGLIYIPLCVFEIRFSPVLHYYLYGFNQHSFLQSVRGSTYRPIVFLQHGLMVGMWISMTAFLGWALGSAGKLGRYMGVSLKLLPPLMLLVLIAMKSLGALILGLLVWSGVSFSRTTGGKAFLLALTIAPLLWALTRTSGALSTDAIVGVSSFVSAERAHSLEFRLDAEDSLTRHAMRKPLFGWSTRGFNRVEEDGRDRAETADGFWLIAFSAYGLVGLISSLLIFCVPSILVLKFAPPRLWKDDSMMFLVGCMGAVLIAVGMDNLLNAMINPMFTMLLGAIPTVICRPGWNDVEEQPDELEIPHTADESEPRYPRLLGQPGDSTPAA
ncbi:MAG: hypothetical protein QM477_09200 [Planctomycetota bacterium]